MKKRITNNEYCSWIIESLISRGDFHGLISMSCTLTLGNPLSVDELLACLDRKACDRQQIVLDILSCLDFGAFGVIIIPIIDALVERGMYHAAAEVALKLDRPNIDAHLLAIDFEEPDEALQCMIPLVKRCSSPSVVGTFLKQCIRRGTLSEAVATASKLGRTLTMKELRSILRVNLWLAYVPDVAETLKLLKTTLTARQAKKLIREAIDHDDPSRVALAAHCAGRALNHSEVERLAEKFRK